MTFLFYLFLTGAICGLLLLLIVTFHYLRDKYAGSFPFAAPLWWIHLRRLWKAIEARYKRAGLPPLSTIFFFVAAVSLYIIGTAIF